LKNNSAKKEKSEYSSSSNHDLNKSKAVTGKELDQLEELSIRLDTLIELLAEKGILIKKEYTNNVMMRLHEISKAKGFEELDEEI
jgi:ATP-dependent 26S proteasome regulatory subunit